MSAIGKWLLNILIGRVLEYLKGLVESYLARKQAEKEREEDNKKAEGKLENAETAEEIVDAGSDLLRR